MGLVTQNQARVDALLAAIWAHEGASVEEIQLRIGTADYDAPLRVAVDQLNSALFPTDGLDGTTLVVAAEAVLADAHFSKTRQAAWRAAIQAYQPIGARVE